MQFTFGKICVGFYRRMEFSFHHDTWDWEYWRVAFGPVVISWWT